MNQKLVIQESFFKALSNPKNLPVLHENGYNGAHDFLRAIIEKLNEEFSFLEISNYRFPVSQEEKTTYSQYGAFVDGDVSPYKKVCVFFTPILSKVGNVVIEQSLMPTICNQMEEDVNFLLDEQYKKIVLLTSKINKENQVDIKYNKMQMDINSLNTLGFDVIPFFPIKNLSTDTKFNSLTEYMDMSDFLQKKALSNAQVEYLRLEKDTLYGYCELSQWEGEFPKSFCFRFLSAIFSGKNDYKYNIDKVVSKIGKLDNQLANLKKFVDHISKTIIKQNLVVVPTDEDTVDSDDEISDIYDINRKPEKALDGTGRKRYKTQKKIRDFVLEQYQYVCDCDDIKHFYFESADLHNYVEGHHIVPMNRQEEYYFDSNVNLDIPNNIIPLCPNCHCQIHLGSRQARIKIISELFVRNKAKLLSFNPNLTLSILASYYNIGMTDEEANDWIKRATKIIEQKASSKT